MFDHGISDRLGVKDNDPRVEWRYKQTRSWRPKYYGCMVEIDASEAICGPIL